MRCGEGMVLGSWIPLRTGYALCTVAWAVSEESYIYLICIERLRNLQTRIPIAYWGYWGLSTVE